MNDVSSLPSSRRSLQKNIENKREKILERTTKINLDIESPVKQIFKTNVLESPMLSPDTQTAIENAEKILEEFRFKITEATKASTAAFNRGFSKESYTDNLEPPLEDETEENLYIRELVSSRLNKINNEISEDSDISTDRKRIVKNKVTKSNVDLLAPKFRTIERRFSDTSCQPKNYYCTPSEQIKCKNSKLEASDKTKSDNSPIETKTHKTKSLTIQKGPPLNIERKLKKQDLGFVHVSPDASFVQDNKNINFYSFSHESCKRKDLPLKNMANERNEKLVDNVAADVTDKLDRSTSKDQVIMEETEIFEKKSVEKNDVAFLTDVVEKKDDVLFEGPINSGRVKKDRGNVSEHLPRTGVDYFTLNEEPDSYCSNNVKKNETNVYREGRKIVEEIVSRDVGTDDQDYLNKDERDDKIKVVNDDQSFDCYDKRTNDDVTKVNDAIEKCCEKKIADRDNSVKNAKAMQERDLNKKFHGIDTRFLDISEKHDSSSEISNKTNKFSARKESTDLSDISLQETDSILNEIELNPPSIELFDNVLFISDKIIDRVSKSEKKIENTLTRLQATLSNESFKPVIDNTEVKSSDLIPFKQKDTRSVKLNFSSNPPNVSENDPMLSLSDKSQFMIINRKEYNLGINSCATNDVLKEDVSTDSSLSNKQRDLEKESRSIKKQDKKMNDLTRLGESTCTIENITDENKSLRLKNKMESFSGDEKLKNLESHKNDRDLQTLLLKNEERREKKFEFERAIINNLSSIGHTPSMLEEIRKYLQTLSNTHTQDISTMFKSFIMDFMKRESGVIFDFLSMQKRDDDTTCTSRLQNGSSLQAIAEGSESKIEKDVIGANHVLQELSRSNDIVYNSSRTIEYKEKLLKVCPLSSIEITPTKYLIDELNQTEIEVSEKGTQYEILCQQNALESDDKIIKDVSSDKDDAEDTSEKKNTKMDEYPTNEVEMNSSNITKVDYVINDDSEKNNKSSEINVIYTDSVKHVKMEDVRPDPKFSSKVLDKLLDSDDCSSHTTPSVKRVNGSINRFTTTSSETSHSEGELYLPSSCSYSLGEVRIIRNSTSMCNHALMSTSTLTSLGETTNLLRHSSGEIYVDSDTL
ncbi:hypothetical protein KPH14_001568 [Odynerus spinipes]|uniref:Uncharacterized protein n=1 Tax=Odynerus spinipes TaxID=1348599 RepID=A0AAD9RZ78_9HYME|nr:hypothetical protein KPH14_001568 [Odynerus spinipes]